MFVKHMMWDTPVKDGVRKKLISDLQNCAPNFIMKKLQISHVSRIKLLIYL